MQSKLFLLFIDRAIARECISMKYSIFNFYEICKLLDTLSLSTIAMDTAG